MQLVQSNGGPGARTLAVPPRRASNRDPDQGADVCSSGSRSGGAGNDGEAELLTVRCIFGWFLTGEDRRIRLSGTATGNFLPLKPPTRCSGSASPPHRCFRNWFQSFSKHLLDQRDLFSSPPSWALLCHMTKNGPGCLELTPFVVRGSAFIHVSDTRQHNTLG